MKDRIKMIREDSQLSMRAFAEKIGVTGGAVAHMESGKTQVLAERTIRAICQEFNVNRRWLETGEDEPYVIAKPRDALAEQVAEIMKGESPMAQAIVVSMLRMPREWWDAWAAEIQKVADAKKGR